MYKWYPTSTGISRGGVCKAPVSPCVPDQLLCWDSIQPCASDPRPWWCGFTRESHDLQVAQICWKRMVSWVGNNQSPPLLRVGAPLAPCRSQVGCHSTLLFLPLCVLHQPPSQPQWENLNTSAEGAVFTHCFSSSWWEPPKTAVFSQPSWPLP